MLKFQINRTTVPVTFEDFFVTVYVIMDGLYRQFAPPEVAGRWHVSDAKLSDSEIITIAICGELVGVDSECAWHSFVKRNYRHLFPNLRSRIQFNRIRRTLSQTTESLRQKLPAVFPMPAGAFASWTAFHCPFANLAGRDAAGPSAAMGSIMGSAPPKKKPISGTRRIS